MARAKLTINSKNYGAWSLRGWLLCKFAGLEFDEVVQSSDDPSTRAELLLLSPSFLVPRLEHNDVVLWDTLAIGEYLHEITPEAKLLPADVATRAKCRAISGEMHSGFANLRAALPMNIRSRHPGFKIWEGARADIDRILSIWDGCLSTYGGPYLFGAKATMADAMYAPVCTRLISYDVEVGEHAASYCKTVMTLEPMAEWVAAAQSEPEEVEELDVEF
jgi:glutathione S-transferase